MFVPYDQLSDAMGSLAREDPKTLGVILVETPWKAATYDRFLTSGGNDPPWRIDRFYCKECTFDPKRNYPLTNLYWAFPARHETGLGQNPRLKIPMVALGRRASGDRERADRF